MSKKSMVVFACVGLLAGLATLSAAGAELAQRFYDFTNASEIPTGTGSNPWRYDTLANASWTASQLLGPPTQVHWALNSAPIAVNEYYRMRRQVQGGDTQPLVTVYPWAKIKVTLSGVPAGEKVDVENQMRITNTSRRIVGHYYVGNGTYVLTTYLADETFYFDDYVNVAQPVPQAELPLNPLTDTMYGRSFVNLDVTKVSNWATDWATRCGLITMDIDWLVITDNPYYPYASAEAGGAITASEPYIFDGEPLTLTAPAGGSTVHYIWFKDGNMLADDPLPWYDRDDTWQYSPAPDFTWTRTGTYSRTVSFTSMTEADEGTYTCLWDDGSALRETEPFDIVVYSAPAVGDEIVSDPAPELIAEGHPLVLTAPNGTGHQWYLDGEALDGETSQTLEFASLSSADSGTYTCIYDDGGTLKETPGFVLSVETPGAGGVITASGQPAWLGDTIVAGYPLILTAPSGVSFIWYKDGVPVEDSATVTGSNTQTLQFSPVSTSDLGTYTCVFDDGSHKTLMEATFELLVLGTVPVAGIAGLALAAAALVALAARGMRRR